LWEQYERIIKDNGAIVLTASQPFTSALVMSNPKLFRYDWVWEKHKGTNFYQVKRAPMKVHESVLVFSKGLYTYNPQMTDGASYKKRGSHHKLPEDHVMTPCKNIGYSDNLDTSKRYPTSVQFFSNHNQKANRFHPTQKPVALLEYLIKTYTNEGETVLDNCMGSGSTGVACVNTNRKFIGIELDDNYFNIAKKRIDDAIKEKQSYLF
jgi:adenine specific DNA methylase Mod